MDAKRNFVQAAIRYYELSTSAMIGGEEVTEEDLNLLLEKALKCALLGEWVCGFLYLLLCIVFYTYLCYHTKYIFLVFDI